MTTEARITWRECILQGALLLLLLAFVFPGTFLRGEMISPGYVLLQMLPWKAHAGIDWPHAENLITWEFVGQFTGWYSVAKSTIAGGEWPLWNPLELTGLPLLANYQSAVFYPFRLLHAFLDIHLASTLFILLKAWLCGATAYVCARTIGLGRGASRFFSIAYMLSLYVMSWTYWCLADVAAWAPIIFLGADSLVEGRARRGFCSIALGATFILLAGHPETAFITSMGTGMYFLARLVWARRSGGAFWKPAGLALGAWLIALLITSIQTIPFVEYVVNSHQYHTRVVDDPSMYSLPPGAFALFWVPRFYGMGHDNTYWWSFWISNYTTIIYQAIAVWTGLTLLLWWKDIAPKQRVRVVCLFIPCVFSVLMAFHHPTTNLIKQLPVFKTIWHIYHISFAVFALPLLASISIDQWFRRPHSVRQLARVTPAVLVIAGAIAGLYLFHRQTLEMEGKLDYVRSQVLLAALFAVPCLAILLAHALWPKPRVYVAALTVLLAVDLLVASRGMHPTTPRNRLFIDTDMTAYFQQMEPPPRVATTSATIAKGLMQFYGVEDWLGFDGIYPLRFMRFWETMGSDLWNAMEPACSVEYYVHLPDLHPFFPRDDRGGFELVATPDQLEIYRNTMAYPRVRLVGNAQVVPSFEEMAAIMRRSDFDPSRAALLEEPPPGPIPENGDAALGEAIFVKRSMNTVEVKADIKRDCILVLADAYFPGWEAEVDGHDSEIFPVYSVFRGILVSPGEHVIRYRYFPLSFRVGLAASTVALTISLAASIWFLMRTLRRRPAGRLGVSQGR